MNKSMGFTTKKVEQGARRNFRRLDHIQRTMVKLVLTEGDLAEGGSIGIRIIGVDEMEAVFP